MKTRLLCLALLALSALASPAFATDITVAATSAPGFTVGNLGSSVTVNVTVANGSPTVTSSAAFRSQWVGLGGFRVSLGGTFYYVSYISSTSSLTLSTNFAGTSGATTMIFYPYVELRLY